MREMAEASAPNHAGTKAYRSQWIKAFEAGWLAALKEQEAENARLREALESLASEHNDDEWSKDIARAALEGK